MMLAQQLYEGVEIKGEGTVGLVSYIRTDSVRVSDEAYEQVTEYIRNALGEKYLPAERNIYKTKKSAQDAHEAIRPTYSSRTPESLKESLSNDQFRLYKLIWERFVSSQITPAVYESMASSIDAGGYIFRINASAIKFKGFLEVYNRVEETENIIKFPKIEENCVLKTKEVVPEQHFTQPPARYTDASLIKTMEELGIGRPSTYAPHTCHHPDEELCVKGKEGHIPNGTWRDSQRHYEGIFPRDRKHRIHGRNGKRAGQGGGRS